MLLHTEATSWQCSGCSECIDTVTYVVVLVWAESEDGDGVRLTLGAHRQRRNVTTPTHQRLNQLLVLVYRLSYFLHTSDISTRLSVSQSNDLINDGLLSQVLEQPNTTTISSASHTDILVQFLLLRSQILNQLLPFCLCSSSLTSRSFPQHYSHSSRSEPGIQSRTQESRPRS